MTRDGDGLLALWIIASTVWDVLVWGLVSYLIFWRGRSLGLIVLGIALTYSESLFRALRKRFDVPTDKP